MRHAVLDRIRPKLDADNGSRFNMARQTAETSIEIRPKAVFLVLTGLSVLLGLLDLGSYALDSVIASEQIRRIFDVNVESSIPTWFSTVQLLIAHGLLLVVALVVRQSGGRFAAHWLFLALVFLGLSIDEMVSLHESTTLAFQFYIPWLGHASWIVVWLPAVGALGVIYREFLFALKPRSLLLLTLAAAIFLIGAAGIEIADAKTFSGGTVSLSNALVVATEEFLERLGIAVFIYWLLRYLRDELDVQRVRFG